MADEPKGYTKAKADALIRQHEEKAAEYDELANSAGTFKSGYVREARAAAEEERRKAENLRELERHWGDTPPPERA